MIGQIITNTGKDLYPQRGHRQIFPTIEFLFLGLDKFSVLGYKNVHGKDK
jgi:hypothetical protein